MASKEREVKSIQINVKLGKQQIVDVLADGRVTRDLCRDPAQFTRNGVASIEPDVVAIVCELGDKLWAALRNKSDSVTIHVDGQKIVPALTPDYSQPRKVG